MKLIKQDIEITIYQLKELYQHRQVDLNNLLGSARCHPCNTGEAIETFKIILTQHRVIRLEGICKNCGGNVNGYSYDTPDSWFIFMATKLQVEGQGGDRRTIKNPRHRDYKETMLWLGGHFDPDYFSVDQVNKELLNRCKLRYP